MNTTLISGQAKCGKTRYILKIFAEEFDKNPVIITPSSESVHYIKQSILSNTSISGFFGFRVITFDHLVNILMEGYEGLSNIGKHFLIRNIVNKMNLKYFSPVKDFIGFYELLSRFISELKQGEILPEIFLDGIEKKGITDKDKEIYEIYSAYQNELRRLNVYDHEGKFWLAQNIIEGGNIGPLSNSGLLMIDGFENFSPSELGIIKSLSKYTDKTIITLTKHPATEKTYSLLKQTFPGIKEIPLPDKISNFNKINIISCPGQFREVEEIAREIKKIILYDGAKPDDIAVVFRDLSQYREHIIDIFKIYGIPFRLSCGIPLLRIPEVRNMLRSLRQSTDIPKKASFLEYMKCLDDTSIKNYFSGLGIEKITSESLEFEEFYNSIVYIADTTELPPPPYSGGTVSVIDAHRARGLSFPFVFIGGLIEKSFPKQIAEEPLYGDLERQILRKYGVNVEESKEKQREETFLFYASVNTASNKLYLTYPATDNEGKEELVSYYVDEIIKQYPEKTEIRKIPLSEIIPEYPSVYTKDQLSSRILFNYSNSRKDKVTDELFKQLGLPSLYEKALFENNRTKLNNGIITDRKIVEILRKDYGPDYKYSASQFNEYGTCPFIYFAKRVLGLEPLEVIEDEIKATEEGKIYHSILKEFYTNNGDLAQIAEKYFRDAEKKGFIKNMALWKIKKKEILNNINIIIEYEKNEPPPLNIKRKPAYFEIAFGKEKSPDIDPRSVEEPLTINRIKIQGIIDRIDLTESGMFVVIDYKSGRYNPYTLSDILNGVYLQLPIYILAARDVLNIGVDALEGYLFYIKRRKYFRTAILSHYKTKAGKLYLNKEWKELLDITKKHLIAYTDAIRKGIFPASPKKECVGYCDYKDICRYQKL